jgi:uncharacterized membrane protein
MMTYLHHTSLVVGLLGTLVILFGVVRALLLFCRSEIHCAPDGGPERQRLRHLLGYYLLVGLEFLIAADIIDTLMKPQVDELLTLGLIVVIRTVISYAPQPAAVTP